MPDVLRDLAPTGVLRAGINFGNPVLAQRDPATGQPRGVSVDLARELGRQLDVGVELLTFDAAGKLLHALKSARGTSLSWPSIPCAVPRFFLRLLPWLSKERTWCSGDRLSPQSKTSIARPCALRLVQAVPTTSS